MPASDHEVDSMNPSWASERQSAGLEYATKGATASAKLIASQASLVLSSYPGGPAFIVTASHVFVRAITGSPSAMQGRLDRDHVDGDAVDGGKGGYEIYTRLSRVSCRVDCSYSHTNQSSAVQATARHVVHGDDTVLKPFDIDVHLISPVMKSPVAGNDDRRSRQGWHAGINTDEMYARFGAGHVHSLDHLHRLFAPSVAAMKITAADLISGPFSRLARPGSSRRGSARANDLGMLGLVDATDYFGENAAKPNPGQVVVYTSGTPRAGTRSERANEKAEDDGWIVCCEWQYWGLRRVTQVALLNTPLRASIPLLDRVVVDSLEIDLSFTDPSSGKFKVGLERKLIM